MTPTEKRYTREVGEIFQYNIRYWYGWEESEKENYVVTVMVAGVTRESNGKYYYKLMKIGGESDNSPYFNLDSVQCSTFLSSSRSRKAGDVGACAPAAPVCANAVPMELA